MPSQDRDESGPASDRPRVIGSCSYDMDDQRWFASFSGDHNPLHVDPILARREMYGEVVVHGIHGVLNALHDFLENEAAGVSLVRMEHLRVRFMRPIVLGTPITTTVMRREGATFRLVLEDSAQMLASIDGTLVPARRQVVLPAAPPERPRASPREFVGGQLRGEAGRLPLWWDAVSASTRWPGLLRLSQEAPAALCALTRIVGMECPGLRSIFSGFEVTWPRDCAKEPDTAIDYRVEDVDPRFSLVRIAVCGSGCSGTVDAFNRPAPQQQPTLAQVRQAVLPDEFSDVVALIVGGSRGIGEVTAKIVAAGGGTVLLTYRQGEREAQDIVDELRRAGTSARMARYDVGTASDTALRSQVCELPRPLNQLYYFPSPKIFVKQRSTFDSALFRNFAACYVDGFAECCRIAKQLSKGTLCVFYPSSEALDAPVRALAEYSAAKGAGETLCHHLNQFDDRLRVLMPRLPRIATDQTLTLAEVPSQMALDVMLPLVRKLRDMR